jgi:hypothetical protein
MDPIGSKSEKSPNFSSHHEIIIIIIMKSSPIFFFIFQQLFSHAVEFESKLHHRQRFSEPQAWGVWKVRGHAHPQNFADI